VLIWPLYEGGHSEHGALKTNSSTMKNYLLTLSIVLAFVAIALAYGYRDTLAGSVGSSYTYKHYTSSNASNTAGVVVKGGLGELGHITFNTATATARVIVYDGATTATSGLSVIANFRPDALGGTYPLEVSVEKGVVVEIPSTFTGDITFGVR